MLNSDLPSFSMSPKTSDLEHVYGELKRSMMMGEFEPGQKLKLDDLAKAFGTSHMPVREALNRLVFARCLVSEPRRSLAIPDASAQRLKELLFLRKDLESTALCLAMRKGRRSLVTCLQDINQRMSDEAQKPHCDVKTYLALNQLFHFECYNRCGNDELISIIELLWMRYGPLLNLLRGAKFSDDNHRQHALMISAIERNDPAAAAKALQTDLGEAAKVILGALQQAGTEDPLP